jgi:hypothetical protein
VDLNLELWTTRDYSTATSICGLFLDGIMVLTFVMSNFTVPLLFVAHYLTFPSLPIYLPSALPYKLGRSSVVHFGFGAAGAFGTVVFANVAFSAAMLGFMCMGD